MREKFVAKLYAAGSKHNWDHITDQIGMFAFTGVGKDQCSELIEKHKVFMTMNGRISIAGLNEHNIDYVANAFHETTKNGRN